MNENETLKAYAVSGTQSVLLALDISKTKMSKDFMGFKITRQQKNKKPVLLNGTKRFPKDKATTAKQELSPIQSFMWKDYTVDPGKSFTYIFEAMFGSWDKMKPKFSVELKVKTEKTQDKEHAIFFNFGVTGSQAYIQKFGARNIETGLTKKEKEKAMKMLGRELYNDGLLKFVAQANRTSHQLLCAFYELEYTPFVSALKAARTKGADVRIVYNAKTKGSEVNSEELKKAGLKSVGIARDFQVAQPHNKFMLLLENGIPTAVWTGSTNITVRGIFGHSNTGHWIKNKEIAVKYHKYWQKLAENPAKKDFKKENEKIQKDILASELKSTEKVIFSPRSTDAMLKEYIAMMDGADQAVCIIFPFNIEDVFKDFYAEDKKYIRFIITDKGGSKTDFFTNDRDVICTQGAVLDSPVEQWVKEITAKKTTGASTLYVHNKFFIVDPLGKAPIVVSGSANFSDESLKDNDENMLVIKGNKRVADIYFSEFARMFDHFLPRFLQKTGKIKKGFSKPLDDQGKWWKDYFDKNKLVQKRKMMFVKMAI